MHYLANCKIYGYYYLRNKLCSIFEKCFDAEKIIDSLFKSSICVEYDETLAGFSSRLKMVTMSAWAKYLLSLLFILRTG